MRYPKIELKNRRTLDTTLSSRPGPAAAAGAGASTRAAAGGASGRRGRVGALEAAAAATVGASVGVTVRARFGGAGEAATTAALGAAAGESTPLAAAVRPLESSERRPTAHMCFAPFDPWLKTEAQAYFGEATMAIRSPRGFTASRLKSFSPRLSKLAISRQSWSTPGFRARILDPAEMTRVPSPSQA